MKDATQLDVELRDSGSSNRAGRLRRSGMIPAVLYGGGRDARTIAVAPRTLIEILQSDAGENTILQLRVADGNEQTALIHDYQVDPISRKLLHADFLRIDLNVELEVDVPIEVLGEPVGVKIDKGILDLVIREVHVRCLPTAIPDQITIDVSELHIGDALHVSDLVIPEGVELLTDPEQTLVLVAAPAVEEVEEVDEAEDLLGVSDEPEVIGKGGDGEEDDED